MNEFSFIGGVYVGGSLVIICLFLNSYLQEWLRKKSLELDLTLGREILEMQRKMNPCEKE